MNSVSGLLYDNETILSSTEHSDIVNLYLWPYVWKSAYIWRTYLSSISMRCWRENRACGRKVRKESRVWTRTLALFLPVCLIHMSAMFVLLWLNPLGSSSRGKSGEVAFCPSSAAYVSLDMFLKHIEPQFPGPQTEGEVQCLIPRETFTHETLWIRLKSPSIYTNGLCFSLSKQ